MTKVLNAVVMGRDYAECERQAVILATKYFGELSYSLVISARPAIVAMDGTVHEFEADITATSPWSDS